MPFFCLWFSIPERVLPGQIVTDKNGEFCQLVHALGLESFQILELTVYPQKNASRRPKFSLRIVVVFNVTMTLPS